MVANIRGYTPNYSFRLINFDTPRWHTLEYDNWSQLDALLQQVYIPTIRGEWVNSTHYIAGDRVIDSVSQLLYRCEFTHDSPASGTFAAYRSLYPLHWTLQIAGVPIYRGAWAPGTIYAQGDIAEVNLYEYHLCNHPHTSLATFPLDANQWTKVFDGTNIVLDAQAAATAAETSASDAAGSASEAFASETNAGNSADAAIAAANAAEGAQGAFRWEFDTSTVIEDPGTGNIRFNDVEIANSTTIALSAYTVDIGHPDVSDWVVTWDDSTNVSTRGTIYMRKVGMPQIFAVLNLNGSVIDNGTWLQIGITPYINSGDFLDGDAASVAFVRAGNQGTGGAGSGDMLSTENLSDVENVATSRNNLGVGSASTPTFAQVLIGTPTVNSNATTKLFVENIKTALEGSITNLDTDLSADIDLKVDKAGDTMAGHLQLPTGPSATSAVRRDYVDAANLAQDTTINSKFPTDASINMTGNLIVKPPSGGAAVTIDPTTSSQVAALHFRQSGVTKWTLQKLGNDNLGLYSVAAAANVLNCVGDATGLLTVKGPPTADLGIATKKFVEDGIAAVGVGVYVPLVGGVRMTGYLVLDNANAPSTPAAQMLSVCYLGSRGGIGLNGYVADSDGAWHAWATGYVSTTVLNGATGDIRFLVSTASVTAGATATFTEVAKISRLGHFTCTSADIDGQATVNTLRLDGDVLAMATWFRANTSINGQIGNDVTSGDFMISAQGQPLSLGTSGSPRMTCSNTSGAWTVNQPIASSTAFTVTGHTTASNYAIRGNCKCPNAGGVLGYSTNDTAYAILGSHNTAQALYHSVWGNSSAYLASGTWSTSDGRLKTVTRDVDPVAALAAVNALTVKEYTPSSRAARNILFGHREDIADDETLYGWVAQEVEQVIPIAVVDVGIPMHDLEHRAAVKGMRDIPQVDSKEAIALGEEAISIKAINDRYMLTTLWTAVQRMSTQYNELREEFETYKAAQAPIQ